MNAQKAIEFIQAHGTDVELARLGVLMHGTSTSPECAASIVKSQRSDGGWAPFWATEMSSVDATCFRLAQCHQLAINQDSEVIMGALDFIQSHQQSDGSFSEDPALAELAPPWAKPGEISATLYLTANCGFWLAYYERDSGVVARSSEWLKHHLLPDGRMPSYLQTHWLTAAMWRQLGVLTEADLVLSYLASRVSDLSGSDLTWMLNTLGTAGVHSNTPAVNAALSRLFTLQQENGSWQSDDGPEWDVHTTLEALRAVGVFGVQV